MAAPEYAVELVVFDCDGVLLDSEHLADSVLLDYCAECHPSVDFGVWRARLAGLLTKKILATMEARHGIRFPPDAEQQVLRRIGERLDREVQPVAGVPDLLARLPLPKSVASNSYSEYLSRLLGRVGLLEHFEGRVHGADQVPAGKPAPDIYLHAAACAGVAPHACLAVEDSVTGVTAAAAAGIDVIGFTGGLHSGPHQADALHRAGARVVIERIDDLIEIVARRGG